MKQELRYLLPAWVLCAAVPLLVLAIQPQSEGKAYWLYLGGVGLVAYSFRRDIRVGASATRHSSNPCWRTRLTACSLALAPVWGAFALGCLVRNGSSDSARIALAFFGLVPALCVTPYLTLATQKPFAAVVFTVFLTIAMKLLGAIVVVSLYGWDADAKGYMTMPWLRSNLLVWLFYANTVLLSVYLYRKGATIFQAQLGLHGLSYYTFS